MVGIVKRAWRPLVCVLEPESAMGNQYLVEPLDARFPKVNVTTRQAEQLMNKVRRMIERTNALMSRRMS